MVSPTKEGSELVPINVDSPSSAAKQTNLRTLDNILLERSKQSIEYPGDFPLMTCSTCDDLFDKVNNWAKNYGFYLFKSSKSFANSARGERRRFSCFRAGKGRCGKVDYSRETRASMKCNCPWEIYVEEVTSNDGSTGWVVFKASDSLVKQCALVGKTSIQYGHNHQLLESNVEKMACSRAFRSIPDCLSRDLRALVEAKLRPSQIFHALVDKCRQDSIDVTFTRKDVENSFSKSKATLDCSKVKPFRSRTQADRRAAIMALATQIAKAASISESSTVPIEQFLKAELLKLNIEPSNDAAAVMENPETVQNQKRNQPAQLAAPTTTAKRTEIERQTPQRKRQKQVSFITGDAP